MPGTAACDLLRHLVQSTGRPARPFGLGVRRADRTDRGRASGPCRVGNDPNLFFDHETVSGRGGRPVRVRCEVVYHARWRSASRQPRLAIRAHLALRDRLRKRERARSGDGFGPRPRPFSRSSVILSEGRAGTPAGIGFLKRSLSINNRRAVSKVDPAASDRGDVFPHDRQLELIHAPVISENLLAPAVSAPVS